MMKKFGVVFLGLLLTPALAQEQAHVAYATPNPDYPLKVHILSSDRHSHTRHGLTDTMSYGSANLLGDEEKGLDWTTDTCAGGFLHNAQHDEFYQGRWKKQDQKIEILTVATGQTHMEKCTISVTMKPKPYSKDNPYPKLVTARD